MATPGTRAALHRGMTTHTIETVPQIDGATRYLAYAGEEAEIAHTLGLDAATPDAILTVYADGTAEWGGHCDNTDAGKGAIRDFLADGEVSR